MQMLSIIFCVNLCILTITQSLQLHNITMNYDNNNFHKIILTDWIYFAEPNCVLENLMGYKLIIVNK